MIPLTKPLQEALDRANGTPLQLVDPRTSQAYIVVRAEVFDKLKAALEDHSDIRDAYPLIDQVARKAGWEAPEWDSYQVYAREERS